MTGITATLKDWALCPGCAFKNFPHYHGAIFTDRAQRWADGTRIRTSPVIQADADGACVVIHTENSAYRLEGPSAPIPTDSL